MSKYTIELREIVETFSREEVEGYFMDYNLEDYLTEQEIAVINERGTWSKERLARKIVDHYLMREIGVETVGLFIQKCKVAMQEIMEEKLPLIYSAAIKYDPLVNVDYTETYSGTNDATSEQKATSSTTDATSNQTNSAAKSSGLNVNSDTPQGQISKSSILAGSYASSTSATEEESNNLTSTNSSGLSDNESSSNGTSQQKQDYEKRIRGNSGISATAQKMVQQYRENIIMIDRDIIKDLASLFIGIY